MKYKQQVESSKPNINGRSQAFQEMHIVYRVQKVQDETVNFA